MSLGGGYRFFRNYVSALTPTRALPAVYRSGGTLLERLPDGFALMLAQASDVADIDISGREFDFVRSIRVYHVRYASQWESGEDDNCNRFAAVQDLLEDAPRDPHPGRAAALARFLDHVAAHDDVWVARRIDIARHWRAQHPPGEA